MRNKPNDMYAVTDPYLLNEKVSQKHGTQTKTQKGYNTRNNM